MVLVSYVCIRAAVFDKRYVAEVPFLPDHPVVIFASVLAGEPGRTASRNTLQFSWPSAKGAIMDWVTVQTLIME